jgi:RNA polymerase sigma-70 factor (ECF subfamily)
VTILARRGLLRLVAATPVANDDLEASVVAALREGHLDALADAYDQWHDHVRVLARRLLGDEAAAEDVVQEVFTALPSASRAFRGEVGLERFVLAITVKRAYLHRRAAGRRRRALERLGRSEAGAGAGGADPERETYRRQLARSLERALDHLPHAQRVAFVLCEVEGLSAAEGSAIAGVPEATMRTRVFHARRKLRAVLGPEHDE